MSIFRPINAPKPVRVQEGQNDEEDYCNECVWSKRMIRDLDEMLSDIESQIKKMKKEQEEIASDIRYIISRMKADKRADDKKEDDEPAPVKKGKRI